MTDLRDRLRGSDPFKGLPPLDEAEAAAIRRAMRQAAAAPKPTLRLLAAGLSLATVASLVAGVLLLGSQVEAPPDAVISLPAQPAWIVPAPELPPVAAVAQAVPRRASPVREPVLESETASSELKEVRFVTTTGTQILWSFRPGEEGA